MKKFIAALLVLTMVLAMTSIAFAYNEKKINDGEGVMVKFKGSAWGYKKVTNNYGKSKSSVAIRKGSIAHAVATKGDWYKVEVPKRGKQEENETFWFNKKYLTEKPSLTEEEDKYIIFSSGGSGRSIANDDLDTYDSFKNKKVKTSGKVNLRSTNSLKGKSQGVVKKGVKVTLTGKAGTDGRGVVFFQVRYSHKKGYISQEYLKSVSKYAAEVKENVGNSGDSGDDSSDED